MKSLSILSGLIILFFAACSSGQGGQVVEKRTLITYVNPFIGTGGHGHTFPGATAPFGMVQLSPDTRLEGWDGCSGYHYSDSIIYGFSHTHLSGTGVEDYCDILLKPCIGKMHWDNGYKTSPEEGYSSYFSKEDETASPGNYQVVLNEGIEVELTATARAGFHKYTFINNENAHIMLDLAHRDKLLGSVLEVINDSTVRGLRRSKSWAEDQHVFFYAQFSKPFTAYTIKKDQLAISETQSDSLPVKAVFHFHVEKEEEILVKVGISAVDMEGAEKNLKSEIKDWSFENTKKQTQAQWQNELSKIEVESTDEEELSIFYTALYHTMIAPNLFSDVDGRYRKMISKNKEVDEEDRIGQLKGEEHYTIFSLWDTYRATHPLYTLIDQKRTNAYINTFLRQYADGDQLPVWELSANYTGCMIGYHSVSVIADAYKKDIRNYDENLALEAMAHSANLPTLGRTPFMKKGYIASGDEPESVSKNLEYAYDDWCIAQLAQEMGKDSMAALYLERAQYYKNLYNSERGFLMARSNGGWVHSFVLDEVNFNYTEANGWQYSLAVPQDVSGLIQLMGGEQNFENHLDSLFTTDSETSGRKQADITGLIGQYAHGNEPSHHMAYLYNYAGKPWKTQNRIQQIMSEMYQNAPDGLSGNEDCGQMSAWYVLSALGFYPVLPGSDEYVIGTPRFEKMTLQFENGKQLKIQANQLSKENKYIQSVKRNGKEYSKSYLKHGELVEGGTLTFEMGKTPNKEWGVGENDRPSSAITENLICISPTIEAESATFEDSITVKINSPQEGVKLYYTINSSLPTKESNEYSGELLLKESTTIKAIAIDQTGKESKLVKAEFLKIPKGRTISLATEYSNQYAAGGNKALIDLLRGGEEFRTGGWQGYEGIDLDATVDLGKVTVINTLGLSCLQDIRSWIWFPPYVEFYTSVDGKKFTKQTVVLNRNPINEEGTYLKTFSTKLPALKAKYIRVVAKNYGVNPKWHLSPGGKAWLFVDEILVNGE